MKKNQKEKLKDEPAKIAAGFLGSLHASLPKALGNDPLQFELAGTEAVKLLTERRGEFSEKEQSFFAMLAWYCLLKREEQEKAPEAAA